MGNQHNLEVMLLQSLILISGKTLNYLENSKNKQETLGNLKNYITGDGSLSLYSDQFKEHFHSSKGALKESIEKYLLPSELNRFNQKDSLFILDICLGLGYNTAILLEHLNHKNIRLPDLI